MPKTLINPVEPHFDALIELIENGYSVVKACKELEVNTSTFWTYIDENDDKKYQYTRARENRGDKCLDKIEEYETQLLNKLIDAPTARVLIDTEKWKACKFYPKMYGEKQAVEVTGKDGTALTPPVLNIFPVKPKE